MPTLTIDGKDFRLPEHLTDWRQAMYVLGSLRGLPTVEDSDSVGVEYRLLCSDAPCNSRVETVCYTPYGGA